MLLAVPVVIHVFDNVDPAEECGVMVDRHELAGATVLDGTGCRDHDLRDQVRRTAANFVAWTSSTESAALKKSRRTWRRAGCVVKPSTD